MPDKRLYTPGPLTTSETVKRAMLRDLGSGDSEFIHILQDIRYRLLALADVAGKGNSFYDYTTILMLGSGTFAIESVISSVMPPHKKLLVIINGAYGRRIAHIAKIYQIPTVICEYPEDTHPNWQDIYEKLFADPDIYMVACVHCETTTGILNPIEEIGWAVNGAKNEGRIFLVDAVSSFGARPINMMASRIDYLVSSADKCIEGVPGLGFVIANTRNLLQTEGYARTVSLDLLAQYRALEVDGQFRFTPPTHALLAFHQALLEIEAEGGVVGRGARYTENHRIITEGMAEMGFKTYINPLYQSHIIITYRYPTHPNFDFAQFYARLNQRGFVIYSGEFTPEACFQICNIGRLYPDDMRALLVAFRSVLDEMEIVLK